jgi:PKD repeat protein
MQRSNGTWISAVPTPKAAPQTGTIDGTSDAPPKGGGTAAPISPGTQTPPPPPRSTASYIKIQFPEQVFVGQKSSFSFTPYISGEESMYGYFYWNMGDGTVYEFSKKEKVQHTYLDVGKYSVTVSFGNNSYVEPLLVETTLVSVLDPSLTLTLEKNGTMLLVSYSGEGVIDVGGWKVVTGEGTYTFPLRSRLLPETALRVKSNAQFSFGSHSTFTLLSSEGLEVATLGKVSVPAKVVARSSSRSLLGGGAIVASETVSAPVVEAERSQSVPGDRSQKKKPTSFIIFGGLILILIGLFVYLDRKLGGREEEEE